MPWWKWVLLVLPIVPLAQFLFFASKSLYLISVRRALLDYHQAVEENRRSRHEPWLRKQRLKVQSLLFESGQYDESPAPREGGRATKLSVYALESLEHWLSEHPKSMVRTRAVLARAIRTYFQRAINGLYWTILAGALVFLIIIFIKR